MIGAQLMSWCPTGPEGGTRPWMSLSSPPCRLPPCLLQQQPLAMPSLMRTTAKCKVPRKTGRQGIAFFPLVAETFGGWHSTAQEQVKKLGSALARHTGQMEGEAITHIWARLGILLQRGNAALLGNRVPELPIAAIDGIE